ncbi:MAG TPA: glycosyltransferase family 4 protein [Acidobacteriota bacterium]|nr:glycosyltransferase family 4 protein [Acidobacteriota bacterium]
MPSMEMGKPSESQVTNPSAFPTKNAARPLRILFCANWAVERLNKADCTRWNPSYTIPGQPYWFFKHANEPVNIEVLDCRCFWGLDRIERKLVRCYPSKGIAAWIRSRRYDLVLSHGGQMGLVIGLLQALAPHLSRTPHVMIDVGAITGGYSGWKNQIITAGCRLAVSSLAAIICHNSKQLNFYRDKYPEVAQNAHFIPLGVDTNEFRPEPCEQEDEIICVGYAKRDWNMLVRAYAGLRTKTRLVLLGIPNGRMIKQNGVDCIPRVGIEEMRNRVRRAKFVALPLENIDYCVGQQTFLQSMAMGKAVLLPRIPAVCDYIRDGATGFLYDVSSEEDLRQKLQMLLSSDDRVELVGRAARAAVEAEFSETVMTDRIIGLLREVAQDGLKVSANPGRNA